MINLIPPTARKQVLFEYWIRVVSIWLLLLACAGVVITILMIPSIVLIHSQFKNYDGVYQNANEKNGLYKILVKKITIANDTATKLILVNNNILFTDLIFKVRGAAPGLVLLHTIVMKRIDGKVQSVQISGNAMSRSSLVHFRDNLESNSLFESVNLPLSNLAKDKNVPFNLTVIINNDIYD